MAQNELLGSDLRQLVSTMGYVKVLYEAGQIPDWWNIKCQKVVIEFINLVLQLPPRFLPLQQKRRSSMQECLQVIKRTTLNDSAHIYGNTIQLIRLLKILGRALISNEEDFLNSWTQLLKDSFKKLWLPVKTDFVDLDSNSLNGFSNEMMFNSWFSTPKLTNPLNRNLPKISSLFYKSLPVGGMVEENTPLIRTRKIKLSLTSLQTEQMKVWANHCRYSYNTAVNIMRYIEDISKESLRDLIVPKEIAELRYPWILETPKSVREGAVYEAYKNRKSGLTNLARGNIETFELRFISKKKESWTVYGIPSVKREGDRRFTMCPKYNLGVFKTKENLPSSTKGEQVTTKKGSTYKSKSSYKNECSIHFDGCDYYLCVPLEVKAVQTEKPSFAVSIDPGVRTMHTCYAPDMETCFKLGNGAGNRLFELDKLIEKLKKKIRVAKTKQSRKFLKMRIVKTRARIQFLQSELHWKTARWMCVNFQHIIIPRFGSQNMINNNTSNLPAEVKRRMMLLAHGKFLNRLMSKAGELGTRVEIVNERNTTRTCSNCDFVKTNIGSAEEWICDSCKFHHDRDCTASRNIFKKQFQE